MRLALIANPGSGGGTDADALAARLRAAGERDAATEVKRLKKPSVAAWAVNHLVRTERARVEALLERGDRLRRAQAKVLAGAGADELRFAAEAERDAVAELVEAAAGILEAAGHAASDAQRERLASTLHVGATTEAGQDALRAGRLTRELAPAGFAAMAGLEAPVADEGPAPRPEPADATTRPRQPSAALRRRRDEARRAADERARQADAAEKDADRLERRADEAERTAARAREAARSARDAAREARRLADEAARRALEIGEELGAETA